MLTLNYWWQVALLAIGCAALWRWFIWPLLYVALYGIGYSILHTIVLDWAKVKNSPSRVVYLVFVRWPMIGMKDAIIWPASSVRIGSWEWVPLFRYRKHDISGWEE